MRSSMNIGDSRARSSAKEGRPYAPVVSGAYGRPPGVRSGTGGSSAAQLSVLMLTIHGTPKRSVHMPNTSPHICLSRGTDTEPPSDNFSQ